MRYSSPLREGDDPLLWLRCELPTWTVAGQPAGPFRADSPTWHIDGISVSAPDPLELVERVRALERMIALAAGRAGQLPVGRPLAGRALSAPQAPLDAAPKRRARESALADPTALGPAEGDDAVARARSRGYSGTPCTTCGSLHTRYSGTCLVCDNCGSTSGCS